MTEPTTPLSRNEIRFYILRAAVGAGAPFGLGEDLAKAALWLADIGEDPARHIAPALAALAEGRSTAHLTALSGPADFEICGIDDRPASALFAGPAAADRIALLSSGGCGRVILRQVDNLLLSAAAIGAAASGRSCVSVSWRSGDGSETLIVLEGNDVEIFGAPGVPPAAGTAGQDVSVVPADLRCGRIPDLSKADFRHGRAAAINQGIPVAWEAWAQILTYFKRSLVPSTGLSRSSGAGAGLIDDD